MIEREIREKSNTNQKRADELQLLVHRGQETERKELIEMQIKLSQLTQENTIKDQFHSKQLLDLKQQLQEEIIEKERLQIEQKSAAERHQHQSQLEKERGELEKERSRSMGDRQLQLLQDRLRESEQELERQRQKCEKAEQKMQELQFQHKKESDDAQERFSEMCSKYDKQIRELRTQINLKGKDIQNHREEQSDLEARLQQKQNELKSMRAQNQVLQSRYEECMAELDQNENGHIKQISRQNQNAIDDFEKQLDSLRNENLDLKEVIRDIKKEKLMLANA